MSANRYIALVARDTDAQSAWRQAHDTVLAAAPRFEIHVACHRLVLVAEPGAARAIGTEGMIIGSVFARGGSVAQPTIETGPAQSIIASRGEELIRAYWGSYVALIAARDHDRIEVVRSPFGDLPCYFFRSPFGLFIASDVEMLVRFAGFIPAVDWSALVRHLAEADCHSRATCLQGLSELTGGERLTESGGASTIDSVWRPWDFVDPGLRIGDRQVAADYIGDAVRTAVVAQTRPHTKTVVRLSGGLDSSIVAACLARADQPFVALTLVTRDRSGDERVHARKVATHLGVELVEAMRDVTQVDLERSAAHNLPRPAARGFAQSGAAVAADIAAMHNASAIIDGGGGDNMFASLKSAAPVADCLRRGGGTGHFWKTARSIGMSAHVSTVEVARRGLIRALTRGPAYRWSLNLDLFTPAARLVATNVIDNAWLDPPDKALAGSAAHVALLVAAQSVVQSRFPQAFFPEISPLIAQPIAEACLRVPGWLWTRDGHNRVIARDAFRADLPAAIVDRRDKGAPDSFVIELIDANHALISAMLTDGLLAKHGIIDASAVASALQPHSIAKGMTYVRLMQLVDAEAWVQSWRARGGC